MGHDAKIQKFMQLQALYNTNVQKTGNFIRPRKRITKLNKATSMLKKCSLEPSRKIKKPKPKPKPKPLNMLRTCSLKPKNMNETLRLLKSLHY